MPANAAMQQFSYHHVFALSGVNAYAQIKSESIRRRIFAPAHMQGSSACIRNNLG
jgi:hypothetical protein